MESNKDPFSGVEGLVVPTDEADSSSRGTDSMESKDGLLWPFVAAGEVPSMEKFTAYGAQLSAEEKELYLSSLG